MDQDQRETLEALQIEVLQVQILEAHHKSLGIQGIGACHLILETPGTGNHQEMRGEVYQWTQETIQEILEDLLPQNKGMALQVVQGILAATMAHQVLNLMVDSQGLASHLNSNGDPTKEVPLPGVHKVSIHLKGVQDRGVMSQHKIKKRLP